MSEFLGSSQLTKMRSDVARMLPDTCTISSVSYPSDGAGGSTEVLTTVATVACRVDPTNATSDRTMQVAAGKEAMDMLYQLTVPYDTDIQIGQRITTGGKQYEIRQLSNAHSWNVSKRAIIVRIE